MIPDEAVEAAARSMFLYRSRSNGPDLGHIWDAEMSEDLKSVFKDEARTTLEVAAPHLMAHAWVEAANTLYMSNAVNQNYLRAMLAQNPYKQEVAQ